MPRSTAHVANKDVHKFDSSLDASMFDFNIPRSVYTQLLADVHANLPTLHRYLKLRQKIMGLPQLGYEDLYAPIVQKVDLQYTPEQAQADDARSGRAARPELRRDLAQGLCRALGRFHADHGQELGRLQQRRCTACTRTSCMNFNGAWDDVSTLAHESGHSMHSYLSSANQPYATAGYSTFVAEVASTLNENLLFHHVLDKTKDDRTRLFLLSSYLDTMRTTLFRQTLFAEFELKIHEAVERGEPLTGESLNKMYLDLLRQYYGHDAGVVKVDERYAAEWALHPAFLPQLLRLPVRDQHDRRHVARRRHDRQGRREVGQGATEPRCVPAHAVSRARRSTRSSCCRMPAST